MYISDRVLPCTVIAAAPASSTACASSIQLIDFSSHPIRIFTVTGTDTARTIDFTISAAKETFFIKADPSPFLTILCIGHPILISTISAPTF